jgi:hypothetical protein
MVDLNDSLGVRTRQIPRLSPNGNRRISPNVVALVNSGEGLLTRPIAGAQSEPVAGTTNGLTILRRGAKLGGATYLMMRRFGRIVPKAVLEEKLYGIDEEPDSNPIPVHVHHLRRQLETASANLEIHTIRGVGYILAERAA